MAAGKYAEWLEDDNLILIAAWARDGLTFEQIAKNMGISSKTLCRWKEKYSPICLALKKGREVADIIVENALYKRAVGYRYTETTRELVANPDTGESKLVVTKTVEKEVMPDTTAQIYWLKNRKPETWRDRRDDDINRNAEIVVKIEGAEGLDE